MIRIADNVITGADRRLMLYFYYSPVSGKNIVRRFTSLTGARVKKDAAFKGFRESGNRMKEASPIAASLYKMIPAEIKQYRLYRLLTGEALKMLKAGSNSKTITETLKEIYIDPLLQEPEKVRVLTKRTRRENLDNRSVISDFTRHLPFDSTRKSSIRRCRRHYAERPINDLARPVENLQFSNPDLVKKDTIVSLEKVTTTHTEQMMPIPVHQISVIANAQNASGKKELKPTKKYPELMYRGRLRECKKLRLWIRSSHFPGASN